MNRFSRGIHHRGCFFKLITSLGTPFLTYCNNLGLGTDHDFKKCPFGDSEIRGEFLINGPSHFPVYGGVDLLRFVERL